jgi:TolA-binding protein
MRIQILIFCGFMLCFSESCKQAEPELSPSEQLQEQVELQEARNGVNPTPESRMELVKVYEAQAQDTALSQTKRLDRVRYIAEALYVANKHDEAYERLRLGLSNLPEATSRLDASLFLAEIAIQKRQEPKTAELIFATLRNLYKGNKSLNKIPEAYPEVLLADAQTKLQQAVYPSTGFDREAANRYGKASWAYTAIQLAPELIIKDHLAAGRVLEQSKNYPFAIKHYDEIIRRFPTNQRAGDALMLKAVVLLEVYDKKDEAREAIETMIAAYPNHDLADDAQALLSSTN